MPTVQANGITIAYDTMGDPRNETMLLIAGLGLQLISWPDAFCQALVAQGYHLVRFDNRDSGLSSKMREMGRPNLAMAFVSSMFHMPVKTPYTLDDMADDALGLLDALGIDKAHIIGVSMGGMIGQTIAVKAPQRVISLTSIMSTSGRPGLPGPTLAANAALMSQPNNPRDIDSVIDHMVRTYQVLSSPGYPTPPARLREQVAAEIRRSLYPSGTGRQLMAIAAAGDRWRQLRHIQAPTLVIHGSDDPLVPLVAGRDAALLIPGAKFHEVKGMGHDLPPGLDVILAGLIAAHCRAAGDPERRRA
ncbi:alpha/beta fold hydrolase [Noviherbaspirillum humi]|uniref:alpha/beta fold hydrolase n=1 Tax=Noviherbaspirillum humi TaxID=1688639 RepID=UPI000B787138|nr:alpha/beta fold hydrolase [Noviherbaspirillum humi]